MENYIKHITVRKTPKVIIAVTQRRASVIAQQKGWDFRKMTYIRFHKYPPYLFSSLSGYNKEDVYWAEDLPMPPF